jgi:alkylation response protein AidB-like acyl-CoA dehydrogenase
MEIGIEYVRERTAFGKKVVENQGIQWYLAEMQTAIEAARSLVFDAARLYDAGQPFATAAAMAKLQATEMANTVCSQAVQLCGGLGLTNEYGVERYLRDAKTTTIIEGTSEILKIVIARSVVGR